MSRRRRVLRARGTLGQSALTPLLDTLFLLLFALLASSRRASMEPTTPTPEEVRVELPTVDPLAGESSDEARELRLVVHVEADDSVGLAGAGGLLPTPTAGELKEALERAASGTSGRVVVEVRADADARHGVTVDVLQTVRAAGIADVRFVATRGASEDDGRLLGASGEGAR